MLDANRKRAHFDEQGRLLGSITPFALPLVPEHFWAQIEEVMFTPMIERAFAGLEAELDAEPGADGGER